MTLPAWREAAIAKSHDRQSFDCGDPTMNTFLRRYARQSHERNASKTFCAIDLSTPNRVLGFYTVAPSQVSMLITDEALSPEMADQIEKSGVKVELA